MKTKLLVGLAGLLLASSTMFAGWRVGAGVRGAYYAHPRGGVYVGVGPGYYGYTAPAPYVAPYADSYVEPAPYVDAYVGPAPFAGAYWVPGRWNYGPRGRYFVRGYWGHRR